MRTRTLVGLFYALLIGVPTVLGGRWSLGLFVLMAAVGGFEFFRMATLGGYRPATRLGMVWLLALILSAWSPQTVPQPAVLTVGLFILFVYALFQTEQPLSTLFSTALVAIYLGLMIGQMLQLRLLPDGMWWTFFGFLVTWSNDTMAYLIGVTLGRVKIWPRLSPKKTWEGTIGGWVGAGLAGALLAWAAPLPIGVATGALIGGCAGVLAFFGDLSISMVKRQVGVKDAGTIFPGHGGMLDRIDSILFVLPFLYQLLWFFALT